MKTKTKLRLSEVLAGITLFVLCFSILNMIYNESTSQMHIWLIVASFALFYASMWYVLKYNIENNENNTKYW